MAFWSDLCLKTSLFINVFSAYSHNNAKFKAKEMAHPVSFKKGF